MDVNSRGHDCKPVWFAPVHPLCVRQSLTPPCTFTAGLHQETKARAYYSVATLVFTS